MSLPEDQKDRLVKYYGESLAEGILQTLEEEQVISLYGDYGEISLSGLNLQIQSIDGLIEDEIRPVLETLTADILRIVEEFRGRIDSLENVIEPDKTDVYNIDRRIELLAQRVAEIESHTKKGKGSTKKRKWRFDKE